MANWLSCTKGEMFFIFEGNMYTKRCALGCWRRVCNHLNFFSVVLLTVTWWLQLKSDKQHFKNKRLNSHCLWHFILMRLHEVVCNDLLCSCHQFRYQQIIWEEVWLILICEVDTLIMSYDFNIFLSVKRMLAWSWLARQHILLRRKS